MGADRIIQGPPGTTGTWGTDSPGSILADVINGNLYVVGNSRKAHLLHKTAVAQGPQAALTNITAQQNLFGITPPAGGLNFTGRMLRLRGWVLFNTTAGASGTITLALTLGGVVLAVITTTATNATALVGASLRFDFLLLVTGAGAAGQVVTEGAVDVQLGASNANPMSTFAVNSATPAAVNLLQSNQLLLTIGASAAIPSAQLAMLMLETLN